MWPILPCLPYLHRSCETLAVFTQHRQALQQHQQFGPAVPFLTCLSVCDMAFTDALASAVHSAAPLLASLTIESDLSSQAALAAATPGLCRLITTCAPSLTSLTFSRNLPSVPQPVADAIAACTSLQHLQVCVCSHAWYPDGYTSDRDSVLRVATVGAALSSLRSLNFQIFSMAEKEALEECLEPMGHATQLTSLCIDSPIFTSRLLTHVLRPLRSSLVRLSLHGYNLEAADLRLLAAEYGQLTYFQFKSKSTGCVPLGLTLMDGARGSVPLPAALRELHLLGFPWAPWDLLALQLPPGLTRLSIDALACHKLAAEDYTTLDEEQESLDNEEEDPDGDGAAGGDVLGCGSGSDTSTDEQPGDGGAGEDASAGTGVGVLPVALPSACPGFNRLLEAVGLLCERGGGDCKGLTLQHDWEPSPRTWPAAGDGHVRLFAALRPLGLRRLELKNCVLEAGDVTALVEQLPELEVGCHAGCGYVATDLHAMQTCSAACCPHFEKSMNPHMHSVRCQLAFGPASSLVLEHPTPQPPTGAVLTMPAAPRRGATAGPPAPPAGAVPGGTPGPRHGRMVQLRSRCGRRPIACDAGRRLLAAPNASSAQKRRRPAGGGTVRGSEVCVGAAGGHGAGPMCCHLVYKELLRAENYGRTPAWRYVCDSGVAN